MINEYRLVVDANKRKYTKELGWLNNNFKPITNVDSIVVSYLLTQHEVGGATYGIQLDVDLLNAAYILRTHIDSGYSSGFIIKVGIITEISLITEGFTPTIEKDY